MTDAQSRNETLARLHSNISQFPIDINKITPIYVWYRLLKPGEYDEMVAQQAPESVQTSASPIELVLNVRSEACESVHLCQEFLLVST
jgi:hypothetical protein